MDDFDRIAEIWEKFEENAIRQDYVRYIHPKQYAYLKKIGVVNDNIKQTENMPIKKVRQYDKKTT